MEKWRGFGFYVWIHSPCTAASPQFGEVIHVLTQDPLGHYLKREGSGLVDQKTFIVPQHINKETLLFSQVIAG